MGTYLWHVLRFAVLVIRGRLDTLGLGPGTVGASPRLVHVQGAIHGYNR